MNPLRDVAARRRSQLRLLALALVVGCASSAGATDPSPPRDGVSEARPVMRLYVYPSQGQSVEKQDRDRYECHRWAVSQTGFDPSEARDDFGQVVLVPVPPAGMETVRGTLVGAALGAGLGAVSGHAGQGAAIGAGVGAIAGAATEAARQQALEDSEARESAARRAEALEDRSLYNRALSACLEGRGYTVR